MISSSPLWKSECGIILGPQVVLHAKYRPRRYLRCDLQGSEINGSIIGCNSFVAKGCKITDSMIMGNDNYSNDRERQRARDQGLSVLGIGRVMSCTVVSVVMLHIIARYICMLSLAL